MNQLDQIKTPIVKDLELFNALFDKSLQHPNVMLSTIFQHILQRKGKLMRPTLLLLVAKEFGTPNECSYLSAVMLELLHTASLVHDDIVDESNKRRGQASVNATNGNKIAVLVGDFLLSSSLEKAAQTNNLVIVRHIANLGKMLSSGEVIQLSNTYESEFSEESYYNVIDLKTASLFAVTAEVGAISVGATEENARKMNAFGHNLGMCFQIRDDIFDYFESSEIGKPTGNDMLEGKLTLPALHVLDTIADESMKDLARKIRRREAQTDEINQLIAYTKANGGIEYAEKRMNDYATKALSLLENFENQEVRNALLAYVDFVSRRNH